jgi:carbon monoxide dehydrogenase subunit G
MELTAAYVFKAPLERVWEQMLDPATVAACLPGCEQCESLGDDRFRIALNARIAAVGGRFSGTVIIADKKPPESYRLIIDGCGATGFASGELIVTLRPTGDEVGVDVHSVIRVGGLIAQVGQRLLGAASRATMDRYFTCLRDKIEATGLGR